MSSERDAFEQKFASNARPARSKCGANGQLVLARICADQKQVRNVDAGNQHHQADGGHDHPQHACRHCR